MQIFASPFLFRTYDWLVNSVEISHLFIALVDHNHDSTLLGADC